MGKYNIGYEAHPEGKLFWERATDFGSVFNFTINDFPEPSNFLKEGDKINFGKSELEVVYTPGHADGSICFINRKQIFVIVGDVLFKDNGYTLIGGYSSNLYYLKMNLNKEVINSFLITSESCNYSYVDSLIRSDGSLVLVTSDLFSSIEPCSISLFKINSEGVLDQNRFLSKTPAYYFELADDYMCDTAIKINSCDDDSTLLIGNFTKNNPLDSVGVFKLNTTLQCVDCNDT
jgi:hypothetical protein